MSRIIRWDLGGSPVAAMDSVSGRGPVVFKTPPIGAEDDAGTGVPGRA
jgi:hypothetical protein